jgi:hypothetical protein
VAGRIFADALIGKDLEISGRGPVDESFSEGLGKTSENLSH